MLSRCELARLGSRGLAFGATHQRHARILRDHFTTRPDDLADCISVSSSPYCLIWFGFLCRLYPLYILDRREIRI